LFAPIRRTGTAEVVGGTLSLARLGGGSSAAKRGPSAPAAITFVASCFTSARAPERKERELGVLAGELTLSEDTGEPEFVVSVSDSAALLSPPPPGPGSERPRRLRVDLSRPTVRLPPGESPRIELQLPPDLTQGARHLEVLAKLAVSGAVESDGTVNDVLDVPLVPRPVLAVQVVDEVGEPLAGVPVEFGEGDGAEPLVTDDLGRAEVDDLGLGSPVVRITDAQGLKAELKARWSKARGGVRLTASEEIATCFVATATEPVEFGEVTRLRLSIQPRVILARLLGLVFETNKSFLLPGAREDLSQLKAISDENPDSELLVVGHTDTSGDPGTNDPLSLERAESAIAFLKQDVDEWLERYKDKVPKARRWGSSEDLAMLQSLPDFFERPDDEDPVTFFQRTRGLTVDGKAGPETRKQLITEYMAREEPILPDDMTKTAHGCGEFFPLDQSGEALDRDPANPERDPVDRRVEFFFFEKEFGIQPAPQGKNSKDKSTEYPEWRKRAELSRLLDLRLSDRVLKLRVQANDENLADEEYSLDIDGRRIAVARTDSEGFITQRLTVDAKLVEIRIPRLALHRSIQLAPSEEFPPVEQLLGVQTRLAQLGFLPKEPDGKNDQVTKDAIRSFRKSRGLGDDSKLDDATRKALREAYGS
jgi:outer membrane protein OmpA-like peptidoglycan-associated protein